MVDRIKHVMEYYEETPAGFAEKVGVNRSNLTHLFTGRNQPSLDFAKKVRQNPPAGLKRNDQRRALRRERRISVAERQAGYKGK